MQFTRAQREEAIKSAAKPLIAEVRIVESPPKAPTLIKVSELALGIREWKRLSRKKEHIYAGFTGDNTLIAVTILTTSPPSYLTFISPESKPSTLPASREHTETEILGILKNRVGSLFPTPMDSEEAKIPERIIHDAVLHLLRSEIPDWLKHKLA